MLEGAQVINVNRKREYIQITQKILETEGLEGIKIRRIAEAAGCTSAVLYKHFTDLDHLVTLASVKFLENYIREFKRVGSDLSLNPIEANMLLWKIFVKEAFRYLPFYERVFFGKYKEFLADTIYEYYVMFPDEMQEMDGFSVSIMFSSDLSEREYIRLRRAANMGLLSMEDARDLSRITVMIFHGMLRERRYDYQEPGVQEKAADECYRLIHRATERFLKEPLKV